MKMYGNHNADDIIRCIKGIYIYIARRRKTTVTEEARDEKQIYHNEDMRYPNPQILDRSSVVTWW